MSIEQLWYCLVAYFGETWTRNYGDYPNPLVKAELKAMTDEERLTIAAAIREWTSAFPPTIPQLLQMADDRPSDNALIGMALTGDDSNHYAAQLLGTMTSFDRQHMTSEQQRRYFKEQLEVLKHDDVQMRKENLPKLLQGLVAVKRIA